LATGSETLIVQDVSVVGERLAGHVERSVGEVKNAYKTSVRKPEKKRSLGRWRRKCENDFKMVLN
jgi:hypothetical protein